MPGKVRVEEWLLPCPIASDVDPARALVPDSKSKHAVDALEKLVPTPGPVPVQQHFRVGLREEWIARLQLLAQLEVVVDLAVKHQRRVAVLAQHGLMASRRKIDDGEP